MKKSYVIATEEEGIRLSVPIHSESNAQLMYNTLWHMLNKASCNHIIANGKNIPLIDGKRKELVILDEKGNKVELVEDAEMYGTDEDNDQEKWRVLDKLQSMAEDDGDAELFDRNAVEESMPRYVVRYGACSLYGQENFTIPVWDEDKANDIANAIKYCMNPNVSLDTNAGIVKFDDIHMFTFREWHGFMGEPGTEIGYEDDPEWASRSDEEFTLTEEDLALLNDKDCMTL